MKVVLLLLAVLPAALSQKPHPRDLSHLPQRLTSKISKRLKGKKARDDLDVNNFLANMTYNSTGNGYKYHPEEDEILFGHPDNGGDARWHNESEETKLFELGKMLDNMLVAPETSKADEKVACSVAPMTCEKSKHELCGHLKEICTKEGYKWEMPAVGFRFSRACHKKVGKLLSRSRKIRLQFESDTADVAVKTGGVQLVSSLKSKSTTRRAQAQRHRSGRLMLAFESFKETGGMKSCQPEMA